MDSIELESKLKKLDEIIAKTKLSKEEHKFIRDFAHEITTISSFIVNKLNAKQWNYLASSPYVKSHDKIGIKSLFQFYIQNNYPVIDYSEVDIRNIDISNVKIPKYYFDTEEKMEKLVSYLKKSKKKFLLSWDDALLFKDLEELKNVRVNLFDKYLTLDDFNHVRRIVNDDSLKFYSEEFINKLKNYYYKTRDPRLWTILIATNIDIPIDVNGIKKGETLRFSYDNLNKAASVSNLLLAAGRTDVKLVIEYIDSSHYGNLSHYQKSMHDSILKKMRTYPNATIEFDDIKDGRLSLKEYLNRLKYYDKVAAKIRSKDLSPLEAYIYAFNNAKGLKIYKFYRNHIINDKYAEISRNPFLILGNKYEVCQGYALYLKEVLERLGIDCSQYLLNTQTDENEVSHGWHARVLTHIIDPEYDVNQLVISDPTFASAYHEMALSFGEEKGKPQELQDEADTNLASAKMHLPRNSSSDEILGLPVTPIPLNKLLWAIRNLKKKTTVMTRRELDKYMSSVLSHFLNYFDAEEYFEYFCNEEKIEDLLDLLDMFGYDDKASILNFIAAYNKYSEMFKDRRIVQIYLTNLRMIRFNQIEYLPANLKYYIILKIFKLEKIDIYNIRIYGDAILFKAFGSDFKIDRIASSEPLIDFASKIRRRAPLYKVGENLKKVITSSYNGYDNIEDEKNEIKRI